jgi:DNA-binding transcriptional ArsR family regulator
MDEPFIRPEISGVECVAVPRWLLERLGSLGDEPLRIVLTFLVAEHAAKQAGVPVTLGELAENAGLSVGRTSLALLSLVREGVVSVEEEHRFGLVALLPPAAEPG